MFLQTRNFPKLILFFHGYSLHFSLFFYIMKKVTVDSNEKRTQKGAPMATLQDIADRLNISKGTVSKALNGAPDISETLQKTVLETAVEMGYTKIRRQKLRRKNSVF